MKRFSPCLIIGLLTFMLLSLAVGQSTALSITKGPYLQNVTQTSIVIIWQTDAMSDSRVDYGAISLYGHNVADTNAMTLHSVTLTNLTTNTLYHYRITSKTSTATKKSMDSTFRTAPSSSTAFRFAVYGDSRSSIFTHGQVVRAIQASKPRIVLHTGDLVGNGDSSSQWQSEFFSPAASLMKKTVLYPTLGNHEENDSLYYSYFDIPDGGGDYNERWYSFDYGNCHFIVLDTNADYGVGSEQYNWLVEELSTATAEWLFVIHHHPAYSSGSHGGEANVQQYLVPLYEQYGVDIVFAGHDHHYERSYKDGVYYIVTGGGGAPLGIPNIQNNPYQQRSARTYHHCIINVNGLTVNVKAKRNNGTVFDSIKITHTTQ